MTAEALPGGRGHRVAGVAVCLSLVFYGWAAQQSGPLSPWSHAFASFGLGLVLTYFLLACHAQIGWGRWWLILWVVSFAVHFRFDVFYHWDDFDVLGRFAEQGLPSVLQPHNEHFLPLGLGLYFLETKLCGIHYGRLILVSTLLHATVGLLLAVFLTKLVNKVNPVPRAAQALSLLWLIAGVHIETMNWAFIQLNMFCEILTLGALIFAVEYLRSGKLEDAIRSALCCLFAPLCFGNGLRLPFMIAPLALFELLRAGKFSRQSLRSFAGLALIVAASGSVVLLYSRMADGKKPSLVEIQAHFQEVASYLLVGTQLATVLRGLGLFPSLYLEAPQHAAPEWIAPYMTAEVFFASIGAVCSLALLAAMWKLPRGRALWFLGQCFLVSAFALPALARWNLGTFQSLAMRYQYNALYGLAVLLMPLFLRFFATAGRTPLRLALSCWVAVFTVSQLYLASELDYFTRRGRENRAYVDRLRHWYAEGREPAATPVMPDGLNPSNDPMLIYRVLHFLDEQRYPLS